MPNLQLTGLMTMGPLEDDKGKIRQAFARTRELFEELKWHKIGGSHLRHLSMGMSHDFEIAIAEGATMVRIGTLCCSAAKSPDQCRGARRTNAAFAEFRIRNP
jgi:uncharacterized pyridoxal phosphate-containing UPF0001 family protein